VTAVPADDERESIFSATTATTTTTTRTTTRRCFEEKTRRRSRRTRIDFAPGRWARGTRKGPKGPPHIVCLFFYSCSCSCFLLPGLGPPPLDFLFSPFLLPSLLPRIIIFFWVRCVESLPACYVRLALHPLHRFPRFPDACIFGPSRPTLRMLSIRHRRCPDPRLLNRCSYWLCDIPSSIRPSLSTS